jgi:hypothetical protein
MTEIPIESSNRKVPAKRWPPEVIELAYQTWAGAAERNVAETVRALAVPDADSPSDSIVKYWKTHHDWEGRRLRELTAVASLPSELHVNRLLVAGAQASKLLAEVALGKRVIPPLQYDAAKYVEAAARSLIIQHSKQDGRRKPVAQARSTTLPTDPDALAQYEQQRRQQRDQHTD